MFPIACSSLHPPPQDGFNVAPVAGICLHRLAQGIFNPRRRVSLFSIPQDIRNQRVSGPMFSSYRRKILGRSSSRDFRVRAVFRLPGALEQALVGSLPRGVLRKYRESPVSPRLVGHAAGCRAAPPGPMRLGALPHRRAALPAGGNLRQNPARQVAQAALLPAEVPEGIERHLHSPRSSTCGSSSAKKAPAGASSWFWKRKTRQTAFHLLPVAPAGAGGSVDVSALSNRARLLRKTSSIPGGWDRCGAWQQRFPPRSGGDYPYPARRGGNEHNNIGILFQAAGFTQVGQDGALVGGVLHGAGKLRRRQHRDLQFARQDLEVARDVGNILDAVVVAVSLDMSWR